MTPHVVKQSCQNLVVKKLYIYFFILPTIQRGEEA